MSDQEIVHPKTPDQEIIHLKDVLISYDDETPVLSHVNLSLKKGEFAYLIGKSGAGKTSLLRSLYAQQSIEGTEASVCGFDLLKMKRRRLPQLRRRIGIVFQNFNLLNDRNVYDNLYFVMRATGWKKRKLIDQRIMQTLESVGIAAKATSRTCQLSEGEQQRVGIARALINEPELILADEPTGNLDPITSSEIMQLLTDINRKAGITMLISTHDFMMIDKFQSRVICCENGTVVDPQ